MWIERKSFDVALRTLPDSYRERVNDFVCKDLKMYLIALQLNMEHRQKEKRLALEIVTAIRNRVALRTELRSEYPAEFRFDCLFLGPLASIMHLRLQYIQMSHN